MHIKHMLTKQLRYLVQHHCSAQCDLCGLTISDQAHSGLWCHHCQHYFQPTPRCACCGLSLAETQPHCGHCLAEPPPWQRLYCLGDYQQPLSGYVHKMKQYESRALVHGLAGLLASRIETPAPLLIPVPLHWRRRLLRGYNQSSVLAHALQYHLGQGVQVDERLIVRHLATPSQQGLSRNARQRNLRHAFRLQGALASTHVAIVDDVVTTGSTVQQICQLLLETGAECIDIYCLCRTPPT